LIISAGDLPDGVTMSSDLAVVGAGPAGITIALEVAKKGLDVILVESGYEKFDRDVQQLAEAAEWNMSLHAPMSLSVRRQLGGTSTIWGGRCVPYDRVDLERRDHITKVGWAVTYDGLTGYYQRACEWLRCGRAAFDAVQMAHLPPAIVPGLLAGDASTGTFERWSLSTDFAREYGESISLSPHVRVISGLTCTEVSSEPGGRRAQGLKGRTLEGKHVTVLARGYVLACGGLETTRLMLASRGPHGEALGDHSGHLGSWYMGHVGGVIADVQFSTPPRSTLYDYERDVDGTHVRRRFSIDGPTQHKRDLPNAIAFLGNPDLADSRHRNGVLSFSYLMLRSHFGNFISPAAQRVTLAGGGARAQAGSASVRSHLVNVVRDAPSVGRFALRFGAGRLRQRGRKMPAFFAAYSGENRYPLQYHGEQIPNRQSRVTLAGSRDAVGMPRLKIDIRFSQQDVDGILRCHEVWDQYLRDSGCGQLIYATPNPAELVWSKVGAGTHQLGTTRMAVRAEDGVVDENLAVHGMSNLFVASSSVLLTSSQANPTFMIVVMALRLADRLGKVIGDL
jgi:choline dehydrogenase-like flavoprotein